MATESKPENMETKDTKTGPDGVPRIQGANSDERLIGYTPAAVPNPDGMADGRTPGVTNTPGPYEAPPQQGAEESSPKSAGGRRGGTTTKSGGGES